MVSVLRARTVALVCCLSLAAAGATVLAEPNLADLRKRTLENRAAYIPAQCFVRVVDASAGPARNPCYVCHGAAREPNQEHQLDLQLSYDFPQLQAGREVRNTWSNLFVDRASQLSEIPDVAVRAYVERDNYHAAAGNHVAARLSQLPVEWDVDGNARWDGFIPDAHFSFDRDGLDRAPDGTPTGWRVFAYRPLPGAFFPSNGSFDDVLIRLPAAFRSDAHGRQDFGVYAVNLAIVEALIKRTDVAIGATDERALGVDLDGDGQLATASVVHYRWQPGRTDSMQYAGEAETQRRAGRLHLAPGLFPEGTEFLHSVRYLAVDRRGQVVPAPRMKELRYSRKHVFLSYSDRIDVAHHEAKDSAQNPDRPEQFGGDAERGLHNAWGWTYQGFIEDAAGELRPQTYEETVHCMGCHGGLSVTTDSAFAFPRKLEAGPARGFYAWDGTRGAPLPDAVRHDGRGEYQTYLLRNPTGDDYRANSELQKRFFVGQRPRRAAFRQLARDASALLAPSAARALALDKAYWLIVREQSYVRGRDALLAPAQHVLREVRAGAPTGIREAVE